MYRLLYSNTVRQISQTQPKYLNQYLNQYQQFKTEVFQKPTYRVVNKKNKKKITPPINLLLTHK